MASQHNSTTHIDKAQRANIAFIANRGHMTHHTEHTSSKRKHYRSGYRYLQKKKAEEPDYLQHSIKIIAVVRANCQSPRKLVRPWSPLEKHKLSNVSTKVLSKTYIRSYHTWLVSRRQCGVQLQQASFDSVSIMFYDFEKLLEVRQHTRVH